MRTSLLLLVLFGATAIVSGQRRYGGRCRDMNCAPSEQCIGFYEQCQKGQTEGRDCGSYSVCVQRDGPVVHPERPAAPVSSSAQGDSSPQENAEKDTNRPVSSNDGGNSGSSGLYPSLPGAQPNTPNPSGGSSYPGAPNNYPGAPNSGGYVPPNYGGGYPQLPNNYPPPGYPAAPGQKDPTEKGGSTFGSFLNFLSGGSGSNNRGGSSGGGSAAGPDLGSLLSLLGNRGGNAGASPSAGGGLFSRIDPGNAGGAAPGGPDLRSLLNSFGGGGGGGSLENHALTNLFNQFRGSGGSGGANLPSAQQPVSNGQYGPQNPSVGGQNAGSNPASSQPANNDGSNFLSILGNLAKSQLANQLIQRATQRDDDDISNRRVGGVYSQNPSSGSRGYPTQASNYPTQAPSNLDVQRTYSANNNAPSGLSHSTDKPAPYGWNV